MRYLLLAIFALGAIGCGPDNSVKPADTVAPTPEELQKGSKVAPPTPPGGPL